MGDKILKTVKKHFTDHNSDCYEQLVWAGHGH